MSSSLAVVVAEPVVGRKHYVFTESQGRMVIRDVLTTHYIEKSDNVDMKWLTEHTGLTESQIDQYYRRARIGYLKKQNITPARLFKSVKEELEQFYHLVIDPVHKGCSPNKEHCYTEAESRLIIREGLIAEYIKKGRIDWQFAVEATGLTRSQISAHYHSLKREYHHGRRRYLLFKAVKEQVEHEHSCTITFSSVNYVPDESDNTSVESSVSSIPPSSSSSSSSVSSISLSTMSDEFISKKYETLFLQQPEDKKLLFALEQEWIRRVNVNHGL